MKMNQKRSIFGIVYDDWKGDIYVFGGLDSGFKYLNKCEKYSV